METLKTPFQWPENFDFYHLGRVERAVTDSKPVRHDPEMHHIAFSLQGDRHGVLLVRMDRDLDPSIYRELGNILVSRLASNLSRSEDLILPSPPRELAPREAERLFRTPPYPQTWFHVTPEGQVIGIESFLWLNQPNPEDAECSN